jgi:hypothetical protein
MEAAQLVAVLHGLAQAISDFIQALAVVADAVEGRITLEIIMLVVKPPAPG